MNADRLLALYDRVAEAPDAVGRMRSFVLELAVRGKLARQDPADEPASELLKQIKVKKQELVKAKIIRKPKLLPDLDPSQLSFTLPRSWCWARIDDLSPRSLTDGDWIETKDQSEDGRVRLIQLADVGVGAFLDKSARFVTEETEVRLRCTRLTGGDILIARLPNPIGRACIFPDIGQAAITAVDVAILRTDRNSFNKYIEIAINAPSTREQIEAYGKGATRFRVSTGHLKTIVLPLPPLAEQHRIVAKVDELMALCERLGEARTAREDTRDRLTKASLTRLNALNVDVPTFRSHARFAVDALPALTARADQVKHLRQTILNLAVRGNLVEQDPADEPASELLKRITAEKARLVKAGLIGKEKPLPSLASAKTSFDLPEGWAWVRLGHLSKFVTSGSRGWAKHYSNEGAIFVRMGNLSKDHYRLRLDQVQRVKPPANGEGTRTLLESGDILISITGNVGMLGLIPEGFGEAYINQHTAMVRPMPEMKGRFLAELFCSPFTQEQFNEPQRGIKNSFRLTDVTQLVIPLPPLAEQHRIVAKVDELIALCDRLETGLATADGTRGRLLESFLHDALAFATCEAGTTKRFEG